MDYYVNILELLREILMQYFQGVSMNRNYLMEYLNENEFRKKERAIKKYNMLGYKKHILVLNHI